VDLRVARSYVLCMRACAASAFADSTLAGFLEEWLAHVRVRVRASTFDGYRALIRCHAITALGAERLEGLRALDLQGLYGRLLAGGLSAGTVLNLHLVLTQAFGQAVRWGLLERKPCRRTNGGRRGSVDWLASLGGARQEPACAVDLTHVA